MKDLRIKFIQSPFYDSNRYTTKMIVIHHTGSTEGKINSVEGTIAWFTNLNGHKKDEKGNIVDKASAHYLIPREPYQDFDIIQFVLEKDVAYHAGNSSWSLNGQEIKGVNRHSIGIELQGDGNLSEPDGLYTEFQYETLIELTSGIMKRHLDILLSNIVGHEHISLGRKFDPGKSFDWKRLESSLASEMNPNTPMTNLAKET